LLNKEYSSGFNIMTALSALTLLVGHLACKTEWLGTCMVTCLKRGANDLHMLQLMPLPPI